MYGLNENRPFFSQPVFRRPVEVARRLKSHLTFLSQRFPTYLIESGVRKWSFFKKNLNASRHSVLYEYNWRCIHKRTIIVFKGFSGPGRRHAILLLVGNASAECHNVTVPWLAQNDEELAAEVCMYVWSSHIAEYGSTG